MSHSEVLLWKQNALSLIEKQQARIAALESAQREPVAVIGVGCRLPGAASPAEFWRLLSTGGDAITDAPTDRWDAGTLCDPDPEAVGKMISPRGGFVAGPDRFDAEFFGMAPREAVSLDPQQRLLLEVSWEALESAGLAADRLAGSNTGVFLGISTHDYAHLLLGRGGACLNAYLGTGTAFSAAAGRLSYFLGLEGPVVAVDTACSSSLVAVHQACDSLRGGQCDLALAAGVNAILTPEVNIAFSRAHMLSPDGRCKTFDAAADGYVRGEGCGVVVLKRLADARRDGDPVLAILRGSAVNHNGRSGGLPVPFGPAQQRVIRAALAQAGVAPEDVDYVEAHGTGTALGDPIEVQALAAALGKGRSPERPLWIGSVKTNIGHLEAAAGVTGLIKVVLALRNGAIPRHLHFQTPNPRVPWSQLPVRVAAEGVSWAAGERRRIAGVSSFGFSGINAHVVVEEAPETPIAARTGAHPPPRVQHLLALSAKSPAAMVALAGSYAQWLKEHPEADLADVCYTAGVGRSHFERRLALTAGSAEEMRGTLAALAQGETPSGVQRGVARGRPRVAFLFTGQGSQYPGMARELYESQPVFRQVLDHCGNLLRDDLPRRLLDVLWDVEGTGGLDQTACTQPCLFALEYALAELWRSWGIVPDVVLGHSVGEYTAACVAGVLTLEDGLKLIARRGALLGALPAGGAMAAVLAQADRVRATLASAPELAVAAENGANTVISGPADALQGVLRQFRAEGVEARILVTSHAFHSHLMEPALPDFEAFAAQIAYRPAERTLITNLTGQALGRTELLDAAYLRRHAREPVQFAQCVQTLAELGCGVLLEVGPQPVLVGMARQCWPAGVPAPAFLASLRRGHGDTRQLCEAAAALHVHGVPFDFAAWDRPWQRRKLDLPTYPFQRQRYWPDEAPRTGAAAPLAGPQPLLGTRQRSAASGEMVYATHFSVAVFPFLGDHHVYETVVVPGAAYAALALQAAGVPARLRDLEILEPLLLDEESGRDVQMVLSRSETSGRQFAVYSTRDSAADDSWTLHARGLVQPLEPLPISSKAACLEDLCDRLPALAPTDLYERAEALGLRFGPVFQALAALRSDGQEVFAEVRMPAALIREADEAPVHPAVLDACTQIVGVLLPDGADADLYLPLRYQQLDLRTVLPQRFFCHGKRRESDVSGRPETLTFDIVLLDQTGVQLGEIAGFVVKRAPRAALLRGLRPDVGRLLYEVSWQESKQTVEKPEPAETWLVLGDGGGVASDLVERLSISGGGCIQASPADFEVNLDSIGALTGVVVLWGLECDRSAGAAERLCVQVLHLVQALARRGMACQGGLWLCTRGSRAVTPTDEVGAPAAAALWGLGRVITAEYPGLRCTLVDFDRVGADFLQTASDLVAEMRMSGAESERALRGGGRFVPRLVRMGQGGKSHTPSGDCRLKLPPDGLLEHLRLAPHPVSQPGQGEIQVRVRAAGLNFRDVLNALGLYPGDAGQPGVEWAGEVVAVGPNVTGFAAGDRVFGLGSGCFARRVNLPTAFVTALPEGASFLEAATIPIAFATAHGALIQAAALKRGERVLIHAATGGVGLAAVQIAQRAGAEIWATASPSKQAFLRSLGIKHVFNSRTTEYAEQILAATDGAGVDVVLNSLTGPDFIARTLSVLAPGGRFVEIGKRDVWTTEQVAKRRPDVAYTILELDRQMREHPAEIAKSLARIARMVADKELLPLPFQVYPLAEAEAAFRQMQRARHVGKIVLSVPSPAEIHADAAYLITGGLGALGLETAGWLVRRGARHLVLAGRRAPGNEARQTIAHLQDAGCSVRVVAADVAREDEVRRLLGEEMAGLPPLRGVFHAAGTLDDALLANQSQERLENVLAPKVRGAWHLHEHTRHWSLDFFVLYSSAASLLGSPGQGNYAAANAFLDALAQHRHRLGLPGLSVAWGPWAGAGMAAGVDGRRWEALGLRPLRAETALAALEAALDGNGSVLALDADWDRIGRTMPGASKGLLEKLLVATAQPANDATQERLRKAPPEQRPALVQDYLQRLLQRVLGSTAAIDPDRGLLELGMDSLMALELRKQVEADLGINVPVANLLGGTTMQELARSLAADFLTDQPHPEPEAPGSEAAGAAPLEEHPVSAGQAGMWVIHQLAPDNNAYNVAVAAQSKGVLDLDAFRSACQLMVRRHSALRTTFTMKNGEILQRVAMAGAIPVETVADVPRPELSRVLAEEVRRPFDLENGPLCRVTLFQHGQAEQTLLLTIHHTVGDFLSVVVLMEEMLLATTHPLREAALPPAPAGFVDYVAWERRWLTTPAAESQLAYWRDQLGGEQPVLALPTDLPRPAVQTFRGGSHLLALDPELVQQLRQLARGEGMTLYVLLLAGWAALLHRHTNQTDLTIGSPTMGRPLPQHSRSVGNFINTLALRLDLSGGPSFRELMKRARQVVYGALENADYPFPLLVREIGASTDPGRSPVFQTMFAYDQIPQTSLFRADKPVDDEAPGSEKLRGVPLHVPQQAGQFELSLFAVDWGNRLDVDLTYNADLYEAETIVQLAEQFRVLLTGANFDLELPLQELPLQTEEDRRRMLVEWNDTRVAYPTGLCLHQLVEAQVRRSPEAVAVSCQGQLLTYRELNSQANRLAQGLRRRGVGPETLVGVCMERAPEMVVALLGILKAGGPYVPLDPDYPRPRLALMLQDACPPVILTQERWRDSLPPSEAELLCLDADEDLFITECEDDFESGATAENLAYVIYTSGSTGVPKGAMNTHRGICNRLLWMQDAYGLTAADCVLQKTPYSFDVSVWEFFWPLLTGARLVVARPGGHREPKYLAALIAEEQVTTTHFVPSMLQAFLGEEYLEGCRSLRRVICSGEALSVGLQERFFSRLPAELHNLYGPTEAAVDVTYWACRRHETRPTVPIGRPIANTQVYVLDERLQPVPAGAPGELHLGGVGLGRGYLNRPELTAEKFIPNPFSAEPAARLYKTGDLARFFPDGNLEFLGRLDGQVKLRGNRIELGEIEAALTLCPGVRQAAATVREDIPGDKRLAAYVVGTDGAAPSAGGLRSFLQGQLPDYMIPSAFVHLAALPLTSSGKLDRKSLPAPAAETAPAGNFVAPGTADEESLASIWAEVLGRTHIGVRDNFFDLGGDSLLAVRMLAAVEKRFACRLPLTDLFREPNIEQLARRLRLDPVLEPASVLVPVQPNGPLPPFFCVHPSGGMALCFTALARLLGQDQPFFAFQSRGLVGDDEPLNRIEEMAALYIETMRAVQPRGPYRLGGWSFGGIVAWEMAQQLRLSGEAVEYLALLDASPASAGRTDTVVPGVHDLLWLAQETGLSADAEALQYLQDGCLTDAAKHLEDVVAVALGIPGADVAQRLTRVHLANRRALQSYQLRPYHGPVHVFRACDEFEGGKVLDWLREARQSPDLGWSDLALGELAVITVPGNHLSMVREPHAAALACALSDGLKPTDKDKETRRRGNKDTEDIKFLVSLSPTPVTSSPPGASVNRAVCDCPAG
jgi:amino acid adenylation domain-containing protein